VLQTTSDHSFQCTIFLTDRSGGEAGKSRPSGSIPLDKVFGEAYLELLAPILAFVDIVLSLMSAPHPATALAAVNTAARSGIPQYHPVNAGAWFPYNTACLVLHDIRLYLNGHLKHPLTQTGTRMTPATLMGRVSSICEGPRRAVLEQRAAEPSSWGVLWPCAEHLSSADELHGGL
jgi:hypothetical protein